MPKSQILFDSKHTNLVQENRFNDQNFTTLYQLLMSWYKVEYPIGNSSITAKSKMTILKNFVNARS